MHGAAGARAVTVAAMPATARRLLLAALLLALACAASPARAATTNHPPTGTFSWTPAEVHSGDTVTFTAQATDPDGDPVTVDWDLDGNGQFEATGPTATGRWTTRGTRTVTMRLSDPKGKSTLVAKTIEILNAAPVAAFTASPASPLADEPVTFTSQSTDPDGGTLDITQAWDLDGDGAFDDADGPIARATFTPGEHVVRLRVTDANGAVTVAEQRVVAVAASPPPVQPASKTAAPLTPFAVVRLSGRILPFGVRIAALTVFGPRGASVTVRCSGGGCPRPGVLRRVVPARGPRSVTIHALRDVLQPGARIAVRVTQPGQVGKYTSFTIRRGAPPLRHDRCLSPGSTAPRRCP